MEEFRLNSKRAATNKLSYIPYAFGESRYQEKDVLLIPQTGSDIREYLPIGFFNSDYIVSNAARTLYNAKPYHFGILASKMHIVWIKAISGRLRMDVQYSVKLSYNTFPFPDITTKQKENLNLYVFAILDERAKHNKTMAQLYNPTTMPKGLLKAHQELDTAIEQCYRLQPFKNDTERLEYLFKQYEEMLKKDTLFAKQKKTRKKKVKK